MENSAGGKLKSYAGKWKNILKSGGVCENSKGRKSLEILRPFSFGRTWGIVQGVVLVDVDLGIHVVLFSCFMSGILECFSLTSFVGTDARIWDIWAFYSGIKGG